MNEKFILIIQYDFPISSITTDLIKSLNENGYKVFLVLCYCKEGLFIEVKSINTKDNELLIINSFFLFKRILNKLYSIFISKNIRLSKFIFKLFRIDKNIINYFIVKKILDYLKKKGAKISSVIGIEKKGVIYGGIISQILKKPLLYYSLELYTDEHPNNRNNLIAQKILELEKKYHKISIATIIQDEDRADFLYNNNLIDDKNVKIIIPVYNKGKIIEKRTNYFYDKFNINKDKKIILYFGVINKYRNINEIINNANREDYILLLHGLISNDYYNSINKEKNIIISKDMVEESKIFDLISSCHIGLAIYRQDIVNDRLTVFSSTKIAQYLKCGIPIIGWNNSNYQKLFNEFKCGELINSFESLDNAISTILKNYDEYKSNAFAAYNKYYNIDFTIKNLTSYLEKNL
ncbi:MAG TPA: hypothetical protein PLG34_01145 [Spirochaetota bacterium]|jgi:hypothetical protein|nr:MAG: hypothetical protein BWX91_00749 [Spirochaetes bacterium ADurb.Bin133]HNZ26109.1 hypothetical protein [Spirochaetota bacterium]HPY86574.1 hypothetical protein [Spirochaetota bacterium]HQB61700.1 hypothetical protein [Spirochaetota bacterium]